MRKKILCVFLLTVLCLPALAEWSVPDFQQSDIRWKDDPLGDCSLSVTSFGAEGCAVTSLAKIFAYYGASIGRLAITPDLLNETLISNGLYTFISEDENGKDYYCNCLLRKWQSATDILDTDDIRLVDSIVISDANRTSSVAKIDAALLQGPVILAGNICRGGYHFVVAVGKDSNGNYIIADPFLSYCNVTNLSPNNISKAIIYESSSQPALFFDVPHTYWAKEHIARLAGSGVVQGQDGYFYPENNVTRGELCTMIVRARGLQWQSSYAENPFSDISDDEGDEHYTSHYRNILICYHKGYVQGVGGNFYPNNSVLRRDAAKMVFKGFELEEEDNPGYCYWKDFFPNEDNYVYASYLMKKNIMVGLDDFKFWPNANLRRSEAAKIICLALDASEE